MITWKNYEEYMMMHADGELTPAEEQELMSFLFEHPELQAELTAFSMSKMTPDNELVFAGKEQLLKPAGVRKIVAFPAWQRYAVAAGVAAILFFSYLKFSTDPTDNTPAVAQAQPAQPAATLPAKSQPAPVNQPATNTTQPNSDLKLAIVTKKEKPVKHPSARTKQLDYPQPEAVAATQPAPETINRIIPAEMVAYINRQNIPVPTVTNVPPAAIYNYEDNEDTRGALLVKIPIDELRQKGKENVATAIAMGYDKINAIKQEIEESSISLKIEKRKLIVSF